MEGASPNPVEEPATQPPIHPPPPQSLLSTQTFPPTPQPPVSADTRKRTFEDIGGSNLHLAKYVKMRALVHDLRPRFVEALGSPDFRNCKAAGEIREEVKALMDLFKQIIGGRVSGDGVPEEQPFMVMENGEAHLEHQLSKHVEKKQRTEEDKFVVGGSAFGWNFVTVLVAIPFITALPRKHSEQLMKSTTKIKVSRSKFRRQKVVLMLNCLAMSRYIFR